MNQRTHSWIAIRAIALLEDENKERDLVTFLKPHAREASVGAWIPDQTDAKRGGSATENHILKMEPFNGSQSKRFVTTKKDLLKHLGKRRAISAYLENDKTLDAKWWKSPYRGDVDKPGQHLPNRAMGLSTMMKDLLLLGSPDLDQLIPGNVHFVDYMVLNSRTTREAAAMHYFMLSHFLADSAMPCHCDARRLAGYSRGLHKELEGHWSKKVTTYFEKKKLGPDVMGPTPNQVLEKARTIDAKFGLDFGNNSIPDLIKGHDVWLEMIFQCRASFALNSIIAPPKVYPYGSGKLAPFKKVLGKSKPKLLKEVDRIVMHDAVLNTAIVWKHVWKKVSSA